MISVSYNFMVFRNFTAAGGGGDFLDEVGDTRRVVLNGEGGFEDVAVAIADEGDVLAFGVVEGDAEDFAGVSVRRRRGREDFIKSQTFYKDITCVHESAPLIFRA